VRAKIVATSGVTAASLSWAATPFGYDDEDLFWLEGQPKPTSENDMSWSLSYVVQEDYLQVMGIPLERGRFFSAQDNERTTHVVVVDDVFAKKFFAGQDPIGKRIVLINKGGVAEIVGVVGHVKQWGLDSDDKQSLRAQLYFPYMQLPDQAMRLSSSGTGVLAKFDGNAPGIAGAIRTSVKQISTEQVMYGVQTMEEMIANSLATRQVSMIVFGVFAALALGLASVGIYGVISYLVGQRTHEIGVRMALGARRLDVLSMVLRDGIRLAVFGVVIGVIAALGLMRLLANLLFGVSSSDPATFAFVAILLTTVALAACYVPARRATKVDPIVALRYE
jgi:predicted permease